MTATNEQIVEEAERRARAALASRCPPNWSVIDYVIEVTREGWTPPEPVDPDLLAVRVVLADQATNRIAQQNYLNGLHDAQTHFQSALAAYKAGRAAR
jgi:hypothetical protein